MPPMMLSISRDNREVLPRRAAPAARIVDHLDSGLDAVRGPLGDHFDPTTHDFSELLDDRRSVASKSVIDAHKHVVLNGRSILLDGVRGVQ